MHTDQRSPAARRAHVDHALASALLAGQAPSALLEELLSEYRAGHLSSAQLVDAVKAHYQRSPRAPE